VAWAVHSRARPPPPTAHTRRTQTPPSGAAPWTSCSPCATPATRPQWWMSWATTWCVRLQRLVPGAVPIACALPVLVCRWPWGMCCACGCSAWCWVLCPCKLVGFCPGQCEVPPHQEVLACTVAATLKHQLSGQRVVLEVGGAADLGRLSPPARSAPHPPPQVPHAPGFSVPMEGEPQVPGSGYVGLDLSLSMEAHSLSLFLNISSQRAHPLSDVTNMFETGSPSNPMALKHRAQPRKNTSKLSLLVLVLAAYAKQTPVKRIYWCLSLAVLYSHTLSGCLVSLLQTHSSCLVEDALYAKRYSKHSRSEPPYKMTNPIQPEGM